MWLWIYGLLATAYFMHYKDFLLFIRDSAYRNMVWNNDNMINVDTEAMNKYLAENYSFPERWISKIFFVFISPIFLVYVLYYIINRLDY